MATRLLVLLLVAPAHCFSVGRPGLGVGPARRLPLGTRGRAMQQAPMPFLQDLPFVATFTELPPIPPHSAAFVGGAIAAGLLSGLTSKWLMSLDTNGFLKHLRKPSWYPPEAVFVPVWTALYSMLGYAAALVAATPAIPLRNEALKIFGVHMGINLMWAPIFFGLRKVSLGAKWSVLLLVAAAVNAVKFGAIEPLAGWLFVPYLGWCAFASALNWSLRHLNRHVGPPVGKFRPARRACSHLLRRQ
jgi:tryptophan-rich sensory protein